MPFWDHVSELAKRLKVVLYVLVVSTVLFMVLPSDLSFLSNPLQFYDPLVALILRAYPKSSAARYVIHAHAMCSMAR